MVYLCKRKRVVYGNFNALFGINGAEQRDGKNIFILAAYVPARAVFHALNAHSAVACPVVIRLGGIALRHGLVFRVFTESVAVQVEFQIAYFVVGIVIICEIFYARQGTRLAVVGNVYIVFADFDGLLFTCRKRKHRRKSAYDKQER